MKILLRYAEVTAPLRLGAWTGALAPLLVAAFALVFGGFESGTRPWSVALGMAALASCAAFGVLSSRFSVLDPLQLGARGATGPSLVGLVAWLAIAVGVVSWWVSPVPRAGLLFWCYGPWLLLLVPAIRRTMASRTARAVAEIGFGLVVCVVSVLAIWDWLAMGSPRAAMPLGHHNLLAIWLVAMLPLAVLPSRWETTVTQRSVPTEWGKRASVIGAVAASLGLMALLATRSLGGALGFGVQVVVVVWTFPRASGTRLGVRRMAAALATAGAVVLAAGWRRLWAFVGAGDRSIEARWQYLQAGVDGWRERPWWGHGPGSSGWTLSEYLDSSGLPAHQVVSDLHSVPFELVYEVGAVGTLSVALVCLMWWRARRAETVQRYREHIEEPNAHAWTRAADVALIGVLTTAVVGGFFDVLAIWVLIPVLLGVRLSVSPPPVSATGEGQPHRFGASRIAAAIAVALVGLVALGPLRAQFSYTRGSFGRAVEADPGHPLYGAALARSNSSTQGAIAAAEAAGGLGALFLSAGALAANNGDLGLADAALVRSCDLSSGDPMAPYLLAVLRDPGPFDATALTEAQTRSLDAVARALLAEPRLLVTPELLARPEVRRTAVELLEFRPEIPIGWRAVLVETETELSRQPTTTEDPVDLVLVTDETGETSLSLFAFRRPPVPAVLARVTIDRLLAEAIQMPPAAVLPGFDAGILAPECRLSSLAR